MKKKILYIMLIILSIIIVGITYIFIKNKNNILEDDSIQKNSVINNNAIDEYDGKNNTLSKWYYKETITKNMPDSNENYKLSLQYLEFKELSVEICYDLCYSVPYTIEGDTLSIQEGEYLSGEFKIKQEDDKMYLEQKLIDDTSLIYIFTKEDN